MTRTALISDVHANLAALEAVLADIEEVGAERVVCLGDVIDYGPDPLACLERVVEVADVLLVGNHEKEVVEPDPWMESDVDGHRAWTLSQLEGAEVWESLLAEMERRGCEAMATRLEPGRHFVHASAASPTDQYVWPAHEIQYIVFNGQIDLRLSEFLDELQRPHGFNGHTHVPALLTDAANQGIFDPYGTGLDWHRDQTFVGPNTIFFVPRGARSVVGGLAGKRAFINPGSVGQPRRIGDPRAAWALYDGDAVEFRRVDYDVEATVARLQALPVSEDFKAYNAERLRSGV